VPSELLICEVPGMRHLKAIEAHLGKAVLLPKQPQYCCPGAAVFAVRWRG